MVVGFQPRGQGRFQIARVGQGVVAALGGFGLQRRSDGLGLGGVEIGVADGGGDLADDDAGRGGGLGLSRQCGRGGEEEGDGEAEGGGGRFHARHLMPPAGLGE
ncbi:hypothetical protein D3C80_1277970 [compost metagenome]